MRCLKIMAFVDYENIWTGLRDRGYELTPERLVQFLHRYTAEHRMELLAIYLYANFDREEFWRTQTSFEKINIFTRHVYGKNNYTNTDLRPNAADSELMLEAQEILLTRPSTIDLFLLLSGDGDFVPLVRKIRAWGKEVRIIGVNGSVHHSLQPYCESIDVVRDFFAEPEDVYDPEADLKKGIQILGEMQIRLPYVASTKARAALSEKLGRSMPRVKEFVRFALREKVLNEMEYPDPSLKIGRTKIYLLNLDHPLVKKVLEGQLGDVQVRQCKLLEGHC